MAESLYNVIEIIETSTESWDKAGKAAVERASKTLRDLRVAEVVEQDIQIKEGLADIDAELEQFSMNAGSAPERICQAHLADQLPYFERHLGPAGSSSRLPAPEDAESSTMPSYNRLRPDDCHRIQNRRREPI